MEHITGLHHIGICTDDLEASLAFYTGVLGFKKLFVTDDRKNSGEWIAKVQKGDITLELIEAENPQSDAAGPAMASRNHIGIACRDIDGCCRELKEKGVAFETDAPQFVPGFGEPPRDISILFFRGPSGELIELYEEL
ncbi:MAG: VOC family protein [Eubacteriales bacterium]|nr:VOC family protein [Eubacteriales bacterium]